MDGETGFLVPPGDREALRRAMERLIIDPALRARMGAAARGNPCKKTHREETCMAFGEWAKLAVKGGAQPISKEKALEIMQLETGRGWRDPELMDLFLRLHRDVIAELAAYANAASRQEEPEREMPLLRLQNRLARDARIGEQLGDFAGIVARDLAWVEAVERTTVVFALVEDRGPAQTRLRALQNQELEVAEGKSGEQRCRLPRSRQAPVGDRPFIAVMIAWLRCFGAPLSGSAIICCRGRRTACATWLSRAWRSGMA